MFNIISDHKLTYNWKLYFNFVIISNILSRFYKMTWHLILYLDPGFTPHSAPYVHPTAESSLFHIRASAPKKVSPSVAPCCAVQHEGVTRLLLKIYLVRWLHQLISYFRVVVDLLQSYRNYSISPPTYACYTVRFISLAHDLAFSPSPYK